MRTPPQTLAFRKFTAALTFMLFASLSAADAPVVHDRVQVGHTEPASCASCRYIALAVDAQQQWRLTRISAMPAVAPGEYFLRLDGQGGVSQFLPSANARRLTGWEIQAAMASSSAKFCDFRAQDGVPLDVHYVESGHELNSIDDSGVMLSQSFALPLRRENTYYIFHDDSAVLCGTPADPRIAARLIAPELISPPAFTETVQASVEKKMRAWLDIPLVPEPVLPESTVLEMDEFESSEAFGRRVEEARRQREVALYAQQQEFRRQVERRNQLITSRKTQRDAYADQLTREATLHAIGPVMLRNAEYDPDAGRMYVDVQSTRTDFVRRMAFDVPAANNQARKVKQRLDQAQINLRLDVNRESISVRDFTLLLDGVTYNGSPAEAQAQGRVVKRIDLRSLDGHLLAASVPSQLQSPDLVDRRVLRYDSGKVVDDLRDAVTAMPAAPVDQKRWLFAVAVENYDNADRVIFAKNSGELMVAALQKKFGISPRNTYALIDDKATAGAFKDQFATLLANIRPGDTVYFYYSGHGIPDQASAEAYILPKDKMVGFVAQEDDLRLSNIYEQLSASPARRIFAFVDSCFSGKTDNISNFKGVAPGVFRTREFVVDERRMTVITAGKHNQFSNALAERGHRMFSYFLLKSLLKPRAAAAPLGMQTLYQEVAVSVRDASHAKGDAYLQEPQIDGDAQARF